MLFFIALILWLVDLDGEVIVAERVVVARIGFFVALVPGVYSGIKSGIAEGGMYKSGTYYLTTINFSTKTATTSEENSYGGCPVWLSCLMRIFIYTFMYLCLGVSVIIYNAFSKKKSAKKHKKESTKSKVLQIFAWILFVYFMLIFFGCSLVIMDCTSCFVG